MREEVKNDKMPQSVPYIIGNELAERFSYYGMKTILTVFMTKFLMDSTGHLKVMSEEDSKFWYHMFVSANYFFPILGALLSDVLWGKYRTIIVLSIVYCGGHIALAMDETRLGLSLGLTMIAIGSGGIKPCVSANVGDQFTESNKHLLPKIFNYFYLAINLGSFVSTLLTPVLLRKFGPSVAFGVPGALMIIATGIFWLGRSKYAVIKPVGWTKYKNDILSKEGINSIVSLIVIYLFMAVFWSLYEQTGSSWVIQAMNVHMIKEVTIFDNTYAILPDQVQALNPVFILILVPLFDAFIYPAISKVFPLTALRKISIGFFICALSFCVVAYMEWNIKAGNDISILWQALAYLIITVAEIMVYGTGLEFSYTQAPQNMKSLIMGFFLLSISLGSFFTAIINWFIQNPDGTSKLEGVDYFIFFIVLMIITSLIFIYVAYRYKEKSFVRSSEVDHESNLKIVE